MSHHWKILSSETRDLTPDLAAEFSGMPASTTERDVSEKRVKHLRETILAGQAIIFDWAKATVLETGAVIRINGQHSSRMLAGLNGNFPEGLKVHLSHYEVENKKAAALLFRQIDGRHSARTIDDISGVYQGLEPDLVIVSKKIGRAAIEGAIWYGRKVVGDPLPMGDDRFDLFSKAELHPYILMAGRVCSIKTPEFTTPVMGAMYGTFEREPTVAEEFWSSVAKEGEGGDGDPAATLDAWLVAAKDADQKPSQWEIYRACVVAWNAFRHRKNLDKIGKLVPGKGIPDIE